MQFLKFIYRSILYLSILLLAIVPILYWTNYHDLLNELSTKSATIGTLILLFSLLNKSLSFLAKKSLLLKSFKSFLQLNTRFQKEQGLIIFNFISIHLLIEFLSNFNSPLFISDLLTIIIPLIIFIYLEITSFRPVQKRYHNWKNNHSIAWMLLPLVTIHVFLLSDEVLKYFLFSFLLIIIALIEFFFIRNRGQKHLIYLFSAIIIAIIEFIYFTI